eukprot:CAMPEP_0181304080 /NCGR_PEP_ID=MMETSP1101-20121128/8936_1 /TAXON_ID=46948 /ORGANISM="Rhodomonas abbreviata, Strain Caron Lab Isolate" /LENGTH=167 /DNA_ID=CAMNT_0023409767 /DNA_START=370 /DNA_END=873 /DNA_ORIENTATION=+
MGRTGLIGFSCRPVEYTEYSFIVHYEALAWNVRLRFSEFVEFDTSMRRMFRSSELKGVDSLPSKTYLSGNASQDLISERNRHLERYLNSLSRSDVVMQSGLLKSFLAFPDEEAVVEAREDANRPNTYFSAGAFAVCRGCRALLEGHRDDLDSGLCSVCARHTLTLSL